VRQQDTDSRAEYSTDTHASALLLEADVQTFSLSNAGSRCGRHAPVVTAVKLMLGSGKL